MDKHTTITIPAGRGARHEARRLARKNPGATVYVVDKRGTNHYIAHAWRNDLRTFTFYWGRRSPVRRIEARRWPL